MSLGLTRTLLQYSPFQTLKIKTKKYNNDVEI
jgi:hypothetical protein